MPGIFGAPRQSLRAAVDILRVSGVEPLLSSHLYETQAVGIGRQPTFLNAVIAVRTTKPAASLLRLLKHVERRAGRSFCRPSGGRPLDLDIIVFRGRVVGRPHRRRARGSLILPHPEAAKRRFVLEPMAEIAPHLPLGSVPVGRMLARMPRPPGSLRCTLDLAVDLCDENPPAGGDASHRCRLSQSQPKKGVDPWRA